MTRVTTGFDSLPYPYDEKDNPNVYFSMGTTAENVAKQYSISRTEQQEFAISSHKKAFEAQTKGNFADEIVHIGNCSQDSNIRPNSTQEKLDGLKLAFDQNGSVTAATSSPLTDGAAATLNKRPTIIKRKPINVVSGTFPAPIYGIAIAVS